METVLTLNTGSGNTASAFFSSRNDPGNKITVTCTVTNNREEKATKTIELSSENNSVEVDVAGLRGRITIMGNNYVIFSGVFVQGDGKLEASSLYVGNLNVY